MNYIFLNYFMTINQLFKKKPPKDLILKLLLLLNIKEFKSDTKFSQKTITDNSVLIKCIPIINELKNFYLPCKQKIYLVNLTAKKIITVIKQCIKLYNYKLLSKEKYINGTKIILYNININKEVVTKNSIIHKNYTLSFD